jgi:quercetin dioxygenase-like cupin family protein
MIRHSICYAAMAVLISSAAAMSEDAVPDALSVEWEGKRPCEKLDEDAQVRILRCIFQPGGVHARHSHPGMFGYTLSGGKITVTDEKGTREAEAKTGAFGTTPPTPWHDVRNVGDTTVSYIVVEKKYQPLPAK